MIDSSIGTVLHEVVRSHNYLFFFTCFSLADRVGADITVLREREVDYDSDVPRKIAEVLIRKVPDDQQVSRTIFNSYCLLVVV